MKIHNFESFISEDYFAGLSKSTVDKKKAQIKKQSNMADDDPDAYKEMPGDTKGKKDLKISQHTKKYHDLYEKEQSTDRSPIDNESVETGLKNKSKETGVPIGILRAVFRRGMAAWKSGHRPGAGQEQWAYARTNSFLTKGKGTWGKADADLAKEVRDGGYDKDLKESVNEDTGTLTIEKRKDGKYYWQYQFKSGKKEDWPEGFDTKADAQKDFMYRSKYIKE